ncbi:mannose-ethanolamine phosphotransferase GPI11 [Sporobolomyces koalae]|uniref:mannose-ethanolamine phosphotransferase GPI11 n=1 Tax=Sporobolomyces koalae TaxID=500713 RepID=UPI003172DA9E
MARGKKSAREPVQRTPATGTPTTQATTVKSRPLSKRLPSPLPFGHYIPRVPLQLAAVYFSLLASSSSGHAQIEGIRFRPNGRILSSIIHDPLRTLPIACAFLAAVQTWVGVWVKGCRRQAIRLAETGVQEQEPKPKRQRRTAKDIFGEMWARAKSGELPHRTLVLRATEPDASGKTPIDTEFVVPAVATTLIGALVFHVCAVLLGAPLVSNVIETALLSLMLSVLAVLPLAIAHPPILAPSSPTERYVWLRFFSSISPNDDLELALLAPALGAIGGCWLGAVPIPLDWDRTWQVWPTTCIIGALLGHAAGTIVSLSVAAFHEAAKAAQEELDNIKNE